MLISEVEIDFDVDAVVTEDAEHAGSDARMAGHASTDDGNFLPFCIE